MKIPKLLKLVESFLSSDKEKQLDQVSTVKDVLKKLKKKENLLKSKLKEEDNKKDRKNIKTELAIIFVKRKKCISRIKELKNK